MADEPAKGKTAASQPKLRARNVAARVALALLFALGLYLSLVPSGRATVKAAALLPALIAASDSPVLKLAGDPVRHTQATVQSQNGPVYLDFYAPDAPVPPIPGARGGVVVIPGVGDERQEPQLINLNHALAGAGLVVANLTTPTLIRYALTPADGDAVVQAVLALAHQPGVDAHRIGILGFSAGGALAAIAATDPRIHDRLAYITNFGGYYDALTLLRDFGRRALDINGALQSWRPQDVPLQVLANTIADTLPYDEGQILSNAFLSPIQPLPADQLAQLSPAGQAAYHLLAGDRPAQVDQNLAALSPAMRDLLSRLSPKAYLPGIRAPIYLLHDRADEFVPFTQSREYAAALTQRGHPHEFVEFSIFQHVEVRSGLDIGPLLKDGSALLGVLITILRTAS